MVRHRFEERRIVRHSFKNSGAPRGEVDFCLEALNEAIYRFGPPEVMNTDQGSQFTFFDWTDRLKQANPKFSHAANVCKRLPATDGRQKGDTWSTFGHSLGPMAIMPSTCRVCGSRWNMIAFSAREGLRLTCQDRRRALNHLSQSPAASRRPRRKTARHGLPQRNRNRSAGVGSSLTHPENCSRMEEWFNP